MKKLSFVLLLAFALSITASSQSGRRVTTPSSTPAAPVQAPVNPEPEIKAAIPRMRAELMYIPERILEREITALDNTTFRLADLHGKVMVINIWASWCGPCRREVPDYEKVRKAYVDQGVEFIALTAEDPKQANANVTKFVRSVDFKFRVGWADRELAYVLMNGKSAIPQTLVVDAKGGVVKHWTGYSPGSSSDRLREAIDQALSVR
jgi:thiol-disulfide isomerase/thioredoxin